MFLSESFEDANQALSEAIEADSKYIDAYVESAVEGRVRRDDGPWGIAHG